MPKKAQTNKALVAQVQRHIDEIYRLAAIEAAKIGVRLDLPPGGVFSLSQFPTAKRRLEQLMAEVDSQIRFIVLNGVEAAWAVANRQNDEMVNRLFGKNLSKLPKSKQRAYLSNNDKALEAFKKTRVLKIEALSAGVWRQGEVLKQIEGAIGLGLSEAKSAAELSRDIRKYLREPNRLYRRVRDAEGKLQLFKAAKGYHPGAGVYRSSYKNAMRVARTEINAAYHTADQLRWDKMDFVVGVRISLSGAHPAYDICDELQGDYPKNFKFTGWHPNCLCQMTAILKTEAEMDRDDALIMAGKRASSYSRNRVKEMPPIFTEWVRANKQRIVTAKKLPYFLSDNRKIVNDILKNL